MAILNYNDLDGFTPQTNLPFTFLLPTHTFAPQLVTYVSSYFLHATFIENFMACLISSKHGFIYSLDFLYDSSMGLFYPYPKDFNFTVQI